MRKLAVVFLAGLILVAGSYVYTQSASTPAKAPAPIGGAKGPMSDADMIKSAMSAAPMAVAKDATVINMTNMKVLKQGTNGWTCFPDTPSPGPDPMCVDKNGLAWASAWMNKQAPPKDKLGFGYMLAGGSDASNTDPFATAPQPGTKWVDTGPHVMILNIGDKFDGYPTVPGDTKMPWVMFPGTPYAHLMIPVK
jgi:hypothetical protein